MAWAPDGPAHRFLFGAVTLEPRPTLPNALRGRVCDSFGALLAADTELFEQTAFLAVGGRPPERTGELHPAGSQHIAGLHLFVGQIDGRPAGTALAMDHERGVLVSAVAVLPDARGRGVGAALTVTALRVAPNKTATLFATAAGLPVYRRLGFLEIGRHRDWHPPRTLPEAGIKS